MKKEIIENLKVEDLENLLSEQMRKRVLDYFGFFENALDTYQNGSELDDDKENYLDAEEYFERYFENVNETKLEEIVLEIGELTQVTENEYNLIELDNKIEEILDTNSSLFEDYELFKRNNNSWAYSFMIDDKTYDINVDFEYDEENDIAKINYSEIL